MAKIKDPLHPMTSGKMNKQSAEVFRVRNGKQQAYTPSPCSVPPSAAQKAHRAEHGSVCSMLNRIMANPQQAAEMERQRIEYNSSLDMSVYPPPRRFKTTREYGYHILLNQLRAGQDAKPAKLTAKTPLPKGVKLAVKPFSGLSASELYEILKSRFSVFMLEQGIRYLDEDNIDYSATHLALWRKGQVIAYVRLFEDTADNVPDIDNIGRSVYGPHVLRAGRMLTVEHGKGYGRIIITHLLAEAKRQGADVLRIHAQIDAVPFYRHFRFTKVGKPFIEAGIEHIVMERKLTRFAAKQ